MNKVTRKGKIFAPAMAATTVKPILRIIAILAILVQTIALNACGGGSSPEEVAEKYVKATLTFDFGTMKKFSSEKNLKKVEEDEKAAKGDIPKEKKEFIDQLKAMTPKAEQAKISEDGSSATVKVEMLQKDGKSGNTTFKAQLVKEKDEWKVDNLGK